MENKTVVVSKTRYGGYAWSTDVYDVSLYIDGSLINTITFNDLSTVEQYYPKDNFKWIKINFDEE